MPTQDVNGKRRTRAVASGGFIRRSVKRQAKVAETPSRASDGGSWGGALCVVEEGQAQPIVLFMTWSHLHVGLVLPELRRHGAAAALVSAVREAALAAGANPLSLVTEPDNLAALGLHRALGFRPVDGLATLSLDLAP